MNDIYLNSFQQLLKNDTVLYLEDVRSNNSIDNYLNKMFKEVLCCNDTQDAMKLFIKNKIDILIVDIHDKESQNRIEMLNSIKGFAPYLPIMVVTTDDNIQYTLDFLEFGFSHVILKPVEMKLLLKEINKVYHNINSSANIEEGG